MSSTAYCFPRTSPAIWRKIADYVVMLHNGRVILDEQKDKLIYQYGIWAGKERRAGGAPRDAVLAVCHSGFGVSALVDREAAGAERQRRTGLPLMKSCCI